MSFISGGFRRSSFSDMKRMHSTWSSGEVAILSAFGDRLGLVHRLILDVYSRLSAHQPSQICKLRASKEIEPYLGVNATDSILANVSSDGRNFLAEVQPVLSLFLGRRAGGRLATRIIEASAVRS